MPEMSVIRFYIKEMCGVVLENGIVVSLLKNRLEQKLTYFFQK